MYCSSCAKQIDSSEKFCKYCGAEQKLLDGTEKNTNKSKNTSQLVDVYLNENFIQSKSFSDLIEKISRTMPKCLCGFNLLLNI